MNIGGKIKKAIECSGMPIIEVAKRLGITNQNMHNIFSRESVETKYLFEVSKILNIPVTSFFDESIEAANYRIMIEFLKSSIDFTKAGFLNKMFWPIMIGLVKNSDKLKEVFSEIDIKPKTNRIVFDHFFQRENEKRKMNTTKLSKDIQRQLNKTDEEFIPTLFQIIDTMDNNMKECFIEPLSEIRQKFFDIVNCDEGIKLMLKEDIISFEKLHFEMSGFLLNTSNFPRI